MKLRWLLPLIVCTAFAAPGPASAEPDKFSFAVIGNVFRHGPNEAALREVIAETDADNLAFVVANGIRARNEACSDRIYQQRKAIYEDAKNGLVLSLTAADWAECRRDDGSSAAVERLSRLRELFFNGEFSFGDTRIPLVRQSTMAQFSGYGENMRWEFGPAIFATLNLPSNNNHYLAAAGRNNEFEDRLVANRYWLQRVFSIARWKKMKGVVLFLDANPLVKPVTNPPLDGGRDGFAEIRKELTELANEFPGQVLLIHNSGPSARSGTDTINWDGNLGELSVQPGWIKVSINPEHPALFASGSARQAVARAARQ